MLGGAGPSRRAQHHVIVALAAAAGAVLAASPTGTPVVDQLWCAAFAGFLAWIGAFARREAGLAVAAGAVAAAVTTTSLALAALAVALTTVGALRPRAASRLKGAAAGAVALSLLTGSGPEPRWLAAATTTALAGALVWSGLAGAGRRRRRLVGRGALALGAVGAIAVGLAGLAGVRARPELSRGSDGLRAARAAAAAGDVSTAVSHFRSASGALARAHGYLATFALPARAVPAVAQQVSAAEVAADAAADTAGVAGAATADLSLDRLRFQGGAIDLGALAAASAPLGQLADSLDATVRRLQAIDRSLLLAPLSRTLEDATVEATAAGRDATRLQRGLEVAPELLGAHGPRRYLVLFTSPIESRNRFGYPGAYAVLRLDHGRVDFEQAGGITELNLPGGFDRDALDVPPRARPYDVYGASALWQSVTIPAHFPAVADVASQLVAQSPVGAVDGVVAADPQALAAVVGLVGDVVLSEPAVSLTAATTADFVNRRQYLEFPELGEQQGERRDLLGAIAEVVGQRLEVVSLPQLSELVDVLSPLLAADHLIIGVPPGASPETAAFLAETGADGGLDVEGDVLHIGHLNSAGNKIDLFLERQVTHDVVVARDGSLRADLTLALTNAAPPSGLPDYLLGSSALADPLPRGTNRTTLMLYSPHELQTISVDGTPAPFGVLADGNVFVYQLQLDLGPGQRRMIVARLSGWASTRPYRLAVLPNGLVNPDDVTVTISDQRSGRSTTDTATVTAPLVLPGPG